MTAGDTDFKVLHDIVMQNGTDDSSTVHNDGNAMLKKSNTDK